MCNILEVFNLPCNDVFYRNLNQLHRWTRLERIPYEHENLHELLERYSKTKSFLGVCLGHQAIGKYFGADLFQLGNVKHGVSTDICITGDLHLFKNIPRNINVGHYHSWSIKKMPYNFRITSYNITRLNLLKRLNFI